MPITQMTRRKLSEPTTASKSYRPCRAGQRKTTVEDDDDTAHTDTEHANHADAENADDERDNHVDAAHADVGALPTKTVACTR